jgi:hypothetical protein
MSQGKQLTYEQKQAIVAVKRSRDAEKTQGTTSATQEPARRTAQALHLRIATVTQGLAAGQKPHGRLVGGAPTPRGHACPIGSAHAMALVRRLLQDAALRGAMVPLPQLRQWFEQRQSERPDAALRRA